MDSQDELYIDDDTLKEDYFDAYCETHLEHVGVKRRSGRYPWGSGEIPYQHEPGFPFNPPYSTPKDFLDDLHKMKKNGLTEREMVKAFNLESSSQLRAAERVAGIREREAQVATAVRLQNEGKSGRQIAKEMGFANESSVRTLLNESVQQRKNKLFDVADTIKEWVDKEGMIDVGEGAEVNLGCTQQTLEQALFVLEAEYGYKILGRRIEQKTNKGKFTTLRVAVPPDTPDDALYNLDYDRRIKRIEDFGDAEGKGDYVNAKPSFSHPTTMARNRLQIAYKEDGGEEKDGLIEIRPNVKDLSLGDSIYSQVRIAVDDANGKPAYYLKGMAVYNDDLPEGIDVRINSNKKRGTPDDVALKPLKRRKDTGDIDWDDPFGSAIKEDGGQYWYRDEKGVERLGLINKRADEGDWEGWSKALPAQFLAKQNPKFVRQQLGYTIADKISEFEDLKKINNPAVKQYELKNFAEGLDSQAVHLKAASLPRQKYQVLLPVPSLKDNEVFATNFKDGETVALVRFPHAGPFEIPILTVNNKNKEALKMIGPNSQDAVGINSYNAGILSGADFDGDTVIVIPFSDKVTVSSERPLKDLRNFNPKDSYPPKYKLDENGNKVLDSDGNPIIISKVMSKANLQKQMGEISNLITDMTLMNASEDKIARAVRHSMVVVDAPKHKLDYEASKIENGIDELRREYQLHDKVDWDGKVHYNSTGAATLLSKAKAQYTAPVHEGYKKIDPETGKWVYTKEGYKKVFDYAHAPYIEESYVDKDTGEVMTRKVYDYSNDKYYKTKTTRSTWMAETEDARTLMRDPNNPIENYYAEFANALKELANQARKEAVNTPNIQYNPEMAIKYKAEVDSLNNKLIRANSNKPREREAQVLAHIMYDERVASMYEELDKSEEKKLSDKMLKKAREICGAQREEIDITPKEWEAIQNGAISHTKTQQIFLKCDQDQLRERATPKERFEWTPAKSNKAIAMADRGYTSGEIAEALGISTSTVNAFLNERR